MLFSGTRITSVAIDAARRACTPLLAVAVDCRPEQPRAFGSEQAGTGLIHIFAVDATRAATDDIAVARAAKEAADGANATGASAAQSKASKGTQKRKRGKASPQQASSANGGAADADAAAASDPPSTSAAAAAGQAQQALDAAHSTTTLLYAMQHDGAYAEALQWCPCAEVFAGSAQGACAGDTHVCSNLLLAVLGNGHALVWAVPCTLDLPSTSASAQDASAPSGPRTNIACQRCDLVPTFAHIWASVQCSAPRAIWKRCDGRGA